MEILYQNWQDRPDRADVDDCIKECRRLGSLYKLHDWGYVVAYAAKTKEGANSLDNPKFYDWFYDLQDDCTKRDYTPEEIKVLKEMYYLIWPNEAPKPHEQSHEVMIDCLLGLIT